MKEGRRRVQRIVLVLDPLDHTAVVQAMARRERQGGPPSHGSNTDGAVIAEICRGWEEMLLGKEA